ncbi:hypothetical protein GY45DRAFT_1168610 [Cubamyces sp. BRFM 1775]|nr:hypothetical protein GY45DRAFT_1168610 [Cubamyces sp. BRFM 1775]
MYVTIPLDCSGRPVWDFRSRGPWEGGMQDLARAVSFGKPGQSNGLHPLGGIGHVFEFDFICSRACSVQRAATEISEDDASRWRIKFAPSMGGLIGSDPGQTLRRSETRGPSGCGGPRQSLTFWAGIGVAEWPWHARVGTGEELREACGARDAGRGMGGARQEDGELSREEWTIGRPSALIGGEGRLEVTSPCLKGKQSDVRPRSAPVFRWQGWNLHDRARFLVPVLDASYAVHRSPTSRCLGLDHDMGFPPGSAALGDGAREKRWKGVNEGLRNDSGLITTDVDAAYTALSG